ncbi:MAG TPA: hypothetical protein VF510_03280 [Ktedonobacterales bacterium]
MSIKQAGYWFMTGALIGFGGIAILSIGFPFIVLGIVLVTVGLIRVRGQEWWAALVGFGGVPALILVWDVTSKPWNCMSAFGGGSLPGVNYYTCVDTPVGPLTSYHIMAIGFGAIALLGLLLALLSALITRGRQAAA